MSEIARVSASAPVPRPGTGLGAQHPPEAAVRDVNALSYGHAVLEFAAVAPAAGPAPQELTSGVWTSAQVRRRAGTQDHYRKGTAWRAEHHQLVVADLEQPLRVRPDGRLTPVAGWAATSTQAYSAAGPLRQRVGRVDQGPVQSAATAGAAGRDADPVPLPAELEHIGVLPSVVQRGFLTAVEEPLRQGSQLIRVAWGSGCTYTATAFVLGEKAAVALHAVRQDFSSSWMVQQFVYSLAGNQGRLLGSSGPGTRRLPPGGV